MACSVSLANYQLINCFSSKGGIKTVWVGVYKEGAFTLDASGNTVTGFSGITPSTDLYKQELRRGIGSMTSTYNYDENAGSIFVQTDLIFQYGKMDKENRIQMNALAIGDLVAVVEDCNGEYYALGVEEPVHATAGTGVTGAARSDANQYEITLTDYCSVFPAHLDASAISLLP